MHAGDGPPTQVVFHLLFFADNGRSLFLKSEQWLDISLVRVAAVLAFPLFLNIPAPSSLAGQKL